MSVSEEKKVLRAQIKRRTAELTPDYFEQSNHHVVQNILRHPFYSAAKMIFCFVGTAEEIDTAPLIRQALADGKRVAVPLCIAKGVMEAREIKSLAELKAGAYGILEPAADSPTVPPDQMEFGVLPCVSCDRLGNRLGHGGGYYDRFLQQAGFPCVLLCRERLLCEHIPTEPHDIRILHVITEAGCYTDGQLTAAHA